MQEASSIYGVNFLKFLHLQVYFVFYILRNFLQKWILGNGKDCQNAKFSIMVMSFYMK